MKGPSREKKSLKICFISHFGYPLYNPQCEDYSGIGGSEVQLYLLSKEFSKKNNTKIYVITGNFPRIFLFLIVIASFFLFYYFYSMPGRLAIKWR
ncbi:hypothetical protein LCGC14_3005850, partial [marine sediment metagenome]